MYSAPIKCRATGYHDQHKIVRAIPGRNMVVQFWVHGMKIANFIFYDAGKEEFSQCVLQLTRAYNIIQPCFLLL